MRVVIIGGTGHIGSFLTPMLVEAGLEVFCVSRGLKKPYRQDKAWQKVRRIDLDRTSEEKEATFGERIAALDGEVVIDLTCYTPESAMQLTEALSGRIGHLLQCGTIWVHGHSVEVPTTEEAPRSPFGEYGIQKAAIERYLLREAQENELPVTVLHPGHLVGPGWNPINPQGNFDPNVFSAILREEEITLPNIGMETVHHVHAEDVAQAFVDAITHRDQVLGESFHVVSPAALTLRGYAEAMFAFFEQPVKLQFLPYEQWSRAVSEKNARTTWDHIAHSPNCSIVKARNLLGYAPRYSSIQAIQESVQWLRENGIVSA
ncbi:NAD-dependent epimerase/dehydratase family protein [Granulicella sp. dw_53]|uniref:NAD-dependent epimerase/dehydratase family protein n=1 Tax=Granulicella sp. dw_53 TaxID=2719792 RepID=UPI001BD6A005|nr:NAD-dependent epimerase/dehydratase family protein [Granulicella sp. dw_53]